MKVNTVKPLTCIYSLILIFGLTLRLPAQTYDTNGAFVQTFAGSEFYGYLDGQGTQTMFNDPSSIAADVSGNLYIADSGNFRIRKIAPDATVITLAGSGNSSIPGYGSNITFSFAAFGSITVDHSNAVLIATGLGLVRIGSDSFVTKTNLTGLSSSSGVCVDSKNNIYYSYPNGNRIYRWRTNGFLEVFAGSGNSGATDGNGVFTSFTSPGSLAVDAADNIYVSDGNNHLIRRINQNQDVVTIAGRHTGSFDGNGTNTGFGPIFQICVDASGNLILACGNSIRKIDAQTNVTTLAGSFTQSGYTNDVPGSQARFNSAQGVCTFGGIVYIADSGNERIRNITNNPAPQVVSGANLGIGTYSGVTISGIVGRTYQIHSSPDMATWTTRATLLLTSSPYLWIDQNPVAGNQYYRAVLLP